MSGQGPSRCPHFQLIAEPLLGDGPASYLAVRRCLLAERLIALLRQKPEGVELSERMTLNSETGPGYAFVGPDLEAVTQQGCTTERCETRCTPSYAQILDVFQINDPREHEVTCDDEQDADATSACSA